LDSKIRRALLFNFIRKSIILLIASIFGLALVFYFKEDSRASHIVNNPKASSLNQRGQEVSPSSNELKNYPDQNIENEVIPEIIRLGTQFSGWAKNQLTKVARVSIENEYYEVETPAIIDKKNQPTRTLF
jgi:hypothetical protein